MVLVAFVGALTAAFGGYALLRSTRPLSTVVRIAMNGTVAVSDLRDRSGLVQVEGEAVVGEAGDTVTAPFTETECLAYTYEVRELRPARGPVLENVETEEMPDDSAEPLEWTTLDTGSDGVGFHVEGETGRVRVDPAGADLRLDAETATVPVGEEPPERIAAWLDAHPEIDRHGGDAGTERTLNTSLGSHDVSDKRRFTEERLDVGDRVTVFGRTRPGSAAAWGTDVSDVLIGGGDDAPDLIISDTTARATAWRFARVGLLRAGVGVGLIAVGLFAVGVSLP